MRVGYMANRFAPLVGEGAGVTSVKDIRYLTIGDDEEILKKITGVGFKSIEVLEGNLTKYSSDLSVLKDMLQKYSAEMMWARTLFIRTPWKMKCSIWSRWRKQVRR